VSTALATLTQKLATTLNLQGTGNLMDTLKSSVFPKNLTVSDEQMIAFLIIANQYGLNPWTKEIYAIPVRGTIVPVVGVDGWSRIINSNPQFDGMEFEQDGESCTCIIWRKDRQRPVRVTEYRSDCQPETTKNTPWESHPHRMLRHKAMIQCARLAFGYGGIYDQDEAERIIEAEPVPPRPALTAEPVGRPIYTAEQFAKNFPKWQPLLESGEKTPAQIIAMVSSKFQLTEEQELAIYDLAPPEAGEFAQAA